MKVFLLAPNEDWVFDRIAKEWNEEHSKMIEVLRTSKEKVLKDNEFEVVASPKMADVVWILADWCWRKIDPHTLSKKKVIITIWNHVPEKFGKAALTEFNQRDQFVDAYHVPCDLVKKQIEPLTKRPVYCQPFWVNQSIWYPKNKHELRQKYHLENDAFLIGSFQRDTESDKKTPRLEKGPDTFCDFVIALHKIEPKIQVLLSGKMRQYVIGRLFDAGIRYHHQESTDLATLNDFYNMLDLYIVGSRHEGGPDAVFECAATRTPIISTNVGYALELLSEKCMVEQGATWRGASDEQTLDFNFNNVQNLFIPIGFKKFEDMTRKVGNL